MPNANGEGTATQGLNGAAGEQTGIIPRVQGTYNRRIIGLADLYSELEIKT